MRKSRGRATGISGANGMGKSRGRCNGMGNQEAEVTGWGNQEAELPGWSFMRWIYR